MTTQTSRLEEAIAREIERNGITGLAIALIRGGETAWSGAYGTASIETGEPMTTDTSLSVMSVTKTIVSTAAMQLRDRGLFQLSDRVNDHLKPLQVRNQWEADSPVHIEQLMTHTAGLPVGTGVGPSGVTLEEYVAAVAQTDHRPGEAVVYANWGFDILGVLIERWSGQRVDEYLREHIFEPLGMGTAVLGDPVAPSAIGHYRSMVDRKVRTLPAPGWPMTPASPAGGCWMSVTDVAKFVGAHLSHGGGMISPETTAEMHQVRAPQLAPWNGQGLGFRVTRANGRRLICHGGDGSGFTAFIGAHPDDGVGVALLINTAAQQVARSVIGNTALATLLDTEPARTFASVAPIEGVYTSNFWDIAVEARSTQPATLKTTEGLIIGDDDNVSVLMDTDGAIQADNGMFHGFAIAAADGAFAGGIYPYEFQRQGDLPVEVPIDENADLLGAWSGRIKTPLGEMTATLDIKAESEGTFQSPITGTVPLENLRADSGHVEGEFTTSMPGAGDYLMIMRLAVRDGTLCGKTFARGNLGEVAMPTDLERRP
jgi:CubicO group peptidase (beta-lactamase class C family)